MKHNYTSNILSQLTNAGYIVSKCHVDNQWQLRDNEDILLRDKAQGDLINKAAKQFGLEWD